MDNASKRQLLNFVIIRNDANSEAVSTLSEYFGEIILCLKFPAMLKIIVPIDLLFPMYLKPLGGFCTPAKDLAIRHISLICSYFPND